jgi:hypothetical protein
MGNEREWAPRLLSSFYVHARAKDERAPGPKARGGCLPEKRGVSLDRDDNRSALRASQPTAELAAHCADRARAPSANARLKQRANSTITSFCRAKGVSAMSQKGQLVRLKRTGRTGEPLCAYRYRVGGRDSKRVQRGGFASERDAAEALERELERLRRGAARGGFLDLHNFRNREWKPAWLAAGTEPVRRIWEPVLESGGSRPMSPGSGWASFVPSGSCRIRKPGYRCARTAVTKSGTVALVGHAVACRAATCDPSPAQQATTGSSA